MRGKQSLPLLGIFLTFSCLMLLPFGCRPAEAPSPNASDPADQTTTPEAKPSLGQETLEVAIPLGLPPLPVPKDNPMTVAKVVLGELLYFDKRVSIDDTVSCATCHDPAMAWAEHTPTSTGIKDAKGHPQVGPRNSPTVINSAYATSQFWDGREPTLEAQAVGPVGNPIEMGHSMAGVVEKLSKIPGYQEAFQEVFGTGVTEEGFAKAIAAFERTVLSGNSPYDKFTAGEKDAMTETQQRGWALFDENCSICHAPPLFSNYRFFNAGIGMDLEKPDKGRMDATDNERDLGKFRVPALREVANTHPYFHDGSVPTLKKAVDIMAGGGIDNPNLAIQFKAIRVAKLTDQDKADLVAFLEALSGEFPRVEPPVLP